MRARLAFAGRFLAFLTVFYAVVAFNPINDGAVVPFTGAVTRVAAQVVRLFDRDVQAVGTTMASSRFVIDVKNGCNAVEVMIFFTAAVLAFPAPMRVRIAGLAAGLPLIQLLNLVRLASLFWIGTRHPSLFNLFHVALWQTVMILIGVTMFVVWSSSASRQTAGRA